MVTVHRLTGGQPYAIEVRPDATVTISVSAEPGVAEITFTDSSTVSVTLILPVEVAHRVFGTPVETLLPRAAS